MGRRSAGAILLVLLAGGCAGPQPRQPTPPAASSSAVTLQPQRVRAAHTATLLSDGRVLIAGGCAVDGCATAEVEPSSEFFLPGRGFVPGPPMVRPRSGQSATELRDGRVLIVGGWAHEGTAPLAQAEIFDPLTNMF